MMNIIPITLHFYCKDCKSYFSKIRGDVLRPFDLMNQCPYCLSQEIVNTKGNDLKELFSFIKFKIKRL